MSSTHHHPLVPTGQSATVTSQVDVGGFAASLASYRPGLSLGVHAHERANMCFLVSGALTETLDRKSDPCRRGQLIVKTAGVVHEDRFHEPSVAINVEIDPARLDAFHDQGARLQQSRILTTPRAASLGYQLFRELRYPDDLTPISVEGLVTALFAEATRQKMRAEKAPEFLRKAEEMLRDGFPRLPSIAELAGVAGVHPTYLAQRFKQVHGVTIGQWMRRARIDFARREIERAEVSLAMLAQRLGFADQSHFSRVFRQLVGMTPTAYASECRG